MTSAPDSPQAPEVGAPRSHRRRLLALVALVLVGLDQFTKWWIVSHFRYGEIRTLTSFLNLTYHRNEGAAFGLWAGGGKLLAIVAALCVVAVLVWGSKYAARSRLAGWGLACLVGGALGNLVDRIRLGHVVDFIVLHLREHAWPTFNVADTCVVIGAGLLIIYGLGGGGSAGEPDESISDEELLDDADRLAGQAPTSVEEGDC